MTFARSTTRLGLVLAGITAVVLAGCTAAPAEPEVELTGSLTIWADDGELPAIEAVGKAFTEKYGVDVNVEEVAFEELRDKFVQAAPAGEGPDILVGPHDMLGSVVSSGLLEPIDLSDEAIEGFVPSALGAFFYDGEQYGVPFATEALGMYVNTDLVSDIPTTWDELMDTAAEVQSSGAAQYGFVLLDANPYYAEPVFTSFGGYVFGKDADGNYDPSDVGLDSKGAIAAAQAISDAVSKGLLTKGIDYETMQNLFKDGQVAMMIDGPWSLAAVQATGVPFELALIPAADEVARPFIGVRGMMESSFSENKLAASVFFNDFMASDEAQGILNDTLKTSSAWASLVDSPSDPLLETFGQSATNGDATPAIPEMAGVWDRWGKAMVALFAGEGDPAEVMKQAAEDIRAQIK